MKISCPLSPLKIIKPLIHNHISFRLPTTCRSLLHAELAYSAHRHVLRVSKCRPQQYPMLCTFKSAILFKVQSLTFLLFFFFFYTLDRLWRLAKMLDS